ncbi:hypothetical protein ACM55H_16950 [Flavobacterium sp. ZT3R17]|uniref:hypothetical protein n=1 Tax=Flavobacterium cryoconiti TaxID=3398736 RepID=UPI003A88AFC4
MKSFLSLLFVSSLLLISCKKEIEPQNSTTPANIVPFTEVGKQMRDQASMSSQGQQNAAMVNQNQASATPVPVAKGMNPAHGQPLHRCDIPVGAPLNSPVASAKNTTVTPQITSPQNQSVSTSPAATTTIVTTPTPEGMNPPHGQTNHRCDIAVGAPLPKS